MTDALFYFFVLVVVFVISFPVGLAYLGLVLYLAVTGYVPQYIAGTDILDVHAVSLIAFSFAIAYRLGGVLWKS